MIPKRTTKQPKYAKQPQMNPNDHCKILNDHNNMQNNHINTQNGHKNLLNITKTNIVHLQNDNKMTQSNLSMQNNTNVKKWPLRYSNMQKFY